MDPAVVIAIIGAGASLLAVVVTARSARKARESAGAIEETRVDAQAYQRARENYDAALAAQDRRIRDLTEGMARDREEHRAEIAELRTRIRDMETRQRTDKVLIRALVGYARGLVQILRQHDIPHPPPPAEMDDA